jgi:multidrug resistance efflux pump
MKFKPTAHKLIYNRIDLKTAFKRTLFCIVLLSLGLFFVPWQQTVYGDGQVIAYSPGERKQIISAPISGLIDKWYVDEGSFVHKGDKIVHLMDQDPKFLERLNAEKNAIEMQIALSKQAADIAYINVERQNTLYKQGIAGRKKYEEAKFKHAKYLNDIAKFNVDLIKVTSRIARQKQQYVVAPQNGTITKRLAGNQSILIKEGDVLAELVPKTDSRAVELMINGNDLPLIHVGDTVILQFEGWPAIQFSGWPSLAVNTFEGKIKVINPVSNGAGYFRTLIIPKEEWPGTNYLRQGVRVHGWIQLNMVPIWFELWRRFNGFPPQPSKEFSK